MRFLHDNLGLSLPVAILEAHLMFPYSFAC